MLSHFQISCSLLIGLIVIFPAELFGNQSITVALGDLAALDANQGSGAQVNADDWKVIGIALAGEGAQDVRTLANANTGSGVQNNSSVGAKNWSATVNANSGSGGQISNSENSNAGNRQSNDVISVLGQDSKLAQNILESVVSGNSVRVSGDSAETGSSISLGENSGFTGLSGIHVIALQSGTNTSQNIGVNVTAGVSAMIPE